MLNRSQWGSKWGLRNHGTDVRPSEVWCNYYQCSEALDHLHYQTVVFKLWLCIWDLEPMAWAWPLSLQFLAECPLTAISFLWLFFLICKMGEQWHLLWGLLGVKWVNIWQYFRESLGNRMHSAHDELLLLLLLCLDYHEVDSKWLSDKWCKHFYLLKIRLP